jgi:hypothetical protein
MAKWKIYEVEVKTTATGKELKKCVIQGEGKQYPDKNVTVWKNEDGFYEKVVAGTELEADLVVKDSTTPNPHAPGTFYKNKTLFPAKQQTLANPSGLEDRVAILEGRLDYLVGVLEQKGILAQVQERVKDDISPDDVPF